MENNQRYSLLRKTLALFEHANLDVELHALDRQQSLVRLNNVLQQVDEEINNVKCALSRKQE